jgi:hypothetical protein
MQKHCFLYAVAFYLIAISQACKPDNNEEILVSNPTYPEVEQALWDFFQHFEYEAAIRGYEVDLAAAGITAKVAEITEEHVAGQCSYGAAIGRNIIIDETFWNSNASLLYKEMVVFHELGHCFLGLGHNEGLLSNGTCASIMRSGAGDCRDNYHAASRSYYLDELFGAGVP